MEDDGRGLPHGLKAASADSKNRAATVRERSRIRFTLACLSILEGCRKGLTTMLKNVPTVISPELMKTLMEMGHGDEIVIADGNFPAASVAQRLIRCDGHGVPEVLEAVLKFFPLDIYVDKPVALMAVVQGDKTKPTIWEQYRKIISSSGETLTDFDFVERFAFYERAKKAYAVVATSEKALYANMILKKGVI